MSRNIRITKLAQTDMRELYRYIADELKNPVAAARRISLIDEAICSLRDNPTRFPVVRDGYLASKGYRMVVVKNHLVFYVVRGESVTVMRVLYGRRDWMNILS